MQVSVTTVLDYFQAPELVEWKLRIGKKEAKRISTVALKIGTRVDQMIQDDVQSKAVKLTAKDSIEVQNCWKAWLSFKQDYSPKVEGFQMELLEPANDLIGHLDLLTDWGVIDVKCASSIKPNYWLQVSKYGQLVGVYSNVAILRLDKNLGVYEYKTAEQVGVQPEQAVKVFNGLLDAYRYFNRPKAEEIECQTS